MVINENLLLGYGNHNNTSRIASYTTSAVAPVEKGRQYTISYTVKKTNRFGVYLDTLSNGWNGNFDNATEIVRYYNTKPGEKITKSVTADINGYMIIYLANNGGDFKEVDFKIEEGGIKTPYVPSKNLIEPSKQAIFVAGGGIPRGVSTLDIQGAEYVS